jgi:hypothetical protein
VLLAPGALPPARGTPDALEAIIRLARAIPVRIWAPEEIAAEQPYGHISNNSNAGRYPHVPRANRTFPGSPLRLSTMAVPLCRSSGVPHCARSQEREPGSAHAMN